MDHPLVMADRLPVWTVLSELFLDTELLNGDIQRIAGVLRQSPYDRIEIERILRDEVSPAFSSNLLSIAGEWVPWDENEVQKIMERSIGRRASDNWIDRLLVRFARRVIPSEWHRIAALL
jgi:hypothetical protein